jgi:hypothetical protein
MNPEPYSQAWERLAARETAIALTELGNGFFVDSQEYCDRLMGVIETIKESQYFQRTVIEPEANELWLRSQPVESPDESA